LSLEDTGSFILLNVLKIILFKYIVNTDNDNYSVIFTNFLRVTVARKNPINSKYGHDTGLALASVALPLGTYLFCSLNFLT